MSVGTILNIRCEHCGHGTEVNDGMGMAGIGHELLECTTCKDIVSVPLETSPWVTVSDRVAETPLGKVELGRCYECGGETFHQLKWRFYDGSRYVECPKCRELAEVTNGGIWD